MQTKICERKFEERNLHETCPEERKKDFDLERKEGRDTCLVNKKGRKYVCKITVRLQRINMTWHGTPVANFK